jgi:hypothetical protein
LNSGLLGRLSTIWATLPVSLALWMDFLLWMILLCHLLIIWEHWLVELHRSSKWCASLLYLFKNPIHLYNHWAQNSFTSSNFIIDNKYWQLFSIKYIFFFSFWENAC